MVICNSCRYLAALLNMEMCLHSMEVVNRLTTVSTCVVTCDDM